MAPASGRDCVALSEQLRHEAYRFEFFQAVRLLRLMGGESARQDADQRRYPVGEDYAPQHEVIRFRASPSQAFPTGSIREIRLPEEPSPDDGTVRESGPDVPEMITAFMGLTGPNGVLPHHYTTLLTQRVREKDFALRDFFDLFNHRVISLFYRAWEKYRFAIAYEHSSSTETADRDDDLFTQCLYCLIGLGTGGLRRRMEFDDEAFLFYGGHFAHYPRSAISLEFMLADYFHLPVKVEQFVGQWLYLGTDDQSSLPTAQRPQGLNTELGKSVVVGERVWDVEGKFRIRLGPLGYADFCRFLPSGDALRPICQMVRSYAGPQFDFDVQPVLKGTEVPWCRLGGDGADAARLGWNTWIRSGQFDHDVSNAVFSLEGLPWTIQA